MKFLWLSFVIVIAVAQCDLVCKKKSVQDALAEFDDAYKEYKKKYGDEKLKKIGFDEAVYGKHNFLSLSPTLLKKN